MKQRWNVGILAIGLFVAGVATAGDSGLLVPSWRDTATHFVKHSVRFQWGIGGAGGLLLLKAAYGIWQGARPWSLGNGEITALRSDAHEIERANKMWRERGNIPKDPDHDDSWQKVTEAGVRSTDTAIHALLGPLDRVCQNKDIVLTSYREQAWHDFLDKKKAWGAFQEPMKKPDDAPGW